jgi:DNA-binding response OmpR family regulator
LTQPTFEFWEGERLRVRCQVCGYPIDAGTIDPVDDSTILFARRKILFIDDDKLLLTLFSNVLRDHDLRPITATDGASGIAIAKKEKPDLILLDIMMPDMDGFEVCRRIRAEPDLQGVPLIILTATADPKLNIKAFKAGADLAVSKSSDIKKLIDTIRTALALKTKPPRT